MTKHPTMGLTTRERQYRHVLESAIDSGRSFTEAEQLAARVTNKYRAKASRRRKHRGPKLVTRGGSRRQWYPGKKVARPKWVCLRHGRRFKSKGMLRRHYGSRMHGPRSKNKRRSA